MPIKLTQKEVEERISNLYNGEYTLVSEYTTQTSPITLRHNCGYEYTIMRAKSFINEGDCKCPKCNPCIHKSTKRLTEEEFIKRLKNEVGDEYIYKGGFVDSHTKLKLLHTTCNNIYEVSPHMFLGVKKRRCAVCGNKNRGNYLHDDNHLQKLLDEKPYGNEFKWLDIYNYNNKEKLRIKHLTCGRIYEVKPNDFQQGYFCPSCAAHKSKEELELGNFIKDNCDYQVITNYREDNKHEVDVYIPELKLGFEMNGYYWHSDLFKDKNFHLDKKEYYERQGINIVNILDVDWTNKKELWKRKILYLLGKAPNKIYARNTNVKYNLSSKKKEKFLKINHLQGSCKDQFNLYLTNDKGVVVALMTFGSNRTNVNNKNEKLELLRYATYYKYSVVGGFSKLLSHAIEYIKKNYPQYTSIYTFADRDISLGNVYLKNGFELDHISKPSYCYVYREKRYNRYSFRKSELEKKFPDYYNPNLSESEIIDNIRTIYRVYNCGNYVFRYDI